ncbi:MAG: COP23 domain-containing protein [Microcystaceae cyanobacterium]
MSQLSLSLNPILIASLLSLIPSAGWSQTPETSPSSSEIFSPQFICQTEQTPPVTVVQMDKETQIIATWYSDYLLPDASPEQICQDVAQRLQNRYESQQPSFFAYEPIEAEKRWDVCLVAQEGQKCTEEGSEVLFSLNSNKFKDPASCILKNTQPNRCRPITRGSLLSVPGDEGYSPRWLNQIFGGW